MLTIDANFLSVEANFLVARNKFLLHWRYRVNIYNEHIFPNEFVLDQNYFGYCLLKQNYIEFMEAHMWETNHMKKTKVSILEGLIDGRTRSEANWNQTLIPCSLRASRFRINIIRV